MQMLKPQPDLQNWNPHLMSKMGGGERPMWWAVQCGESPLDLREASAISRF